MRALPIVLAVSVALLSGCQPGGSSENPDSTTAASPAATIATLPATSDDVNAYPVPIETVQVIDAQTAEVTVLLTSCEQLAAVTATGDNSTITITATATSDPECVGGETITVTGGVILNPLLAGQQLIDGSSGQPLTGSN